MRSERDVHGEPARAAARPASEAPAAHAAEAGASALRRDGGALFELDTMLRGIVALGRPHNLPGPASSHTASSIDHQAHVRVVRDACHRVVQLARGLLRAQSAEGGGPLRRGSSPPRPGLATPSSEPADEDLAALRDAFAHFVDLADGLARSGRLPHRPWAAFHGVVQREIERSGRYRPAVSIAPRSPLDCAAEYDLLQVIDSARSAPMRPVLEVAFVTLSRSLRQLDLLEVQAREPATHRRAVAILAALRSELRGLTRALVEEAPASLASGFEQAVLAVPARRIRGDYDALRAEARALVSLRGTLVGTATGLRLEIRRVFEQELPSLDGAEGGEGSGGRLLAATSSLRAALHHALRAISAEVRPDLKLESLVEAPAVRRAASERARRDAYLMQQIVRAFLAFADEGPARSADGWQDHGGLHFVRDYLRHVQVLGYAVLRFHDYPRLGAYVAALDALRLLEAPDDARLAQAAEESARCQTFLATLVERIGQRPELLGVPLDRAAALETMRIHLRPA
jgi:hypothetical protein